MAYTILLNFSLLKTVFLCVPLILSIFGLMLLKYYVKLRVKVAYWESNGANATHIYVEGNSEGEAEIV